MNGEVYKIKERTRIDIGSSSASHISAHEAVAVAAPFQA
ncbi:MAG: hypothetical protein ACI9ES_002135 [Oceanospirillaceae bacterium]|jgi:hypothetical protein